MEAIRKIVVGLDLDAAGALTAGAALALAEARWLALQSDAHVTLVHSTRPDERWDAGRGRFLAAHESRARDGGDALERATAELRGAGLKGELVCTGETAWLAIVRQVLREGAHAAVVGKRADPDHDDRRIGSVALKLLRKCPCSVWVARPGSPTPPRVILAASGGGEVGARVVALAASLAAASGADLHVVHALEIPLQIQLEGDEASSSHLSDRSTRAASEIRVQLAAAGLEGRGEIHAGPTSPSHAVLEGVAALAADLVVMGTVARGGIAGLLVGNTAERLLGRLDCSILAVKPVDFVCPVTLDASP